MRLKLTGTSSQNEQNERIEALRTLIERLSAPELTLAEAKLLRGELFELLEPADGTAVRDRMTSAPSLLPYPSCGDGPRHNHRAPEPSMWAAG